MITDQLLSKLGMPFTEGAFDQLLKSIEILERPKFREDSTVFLESKGRGISLKFQEVSLFEEVYGRARLEISASARKSGIFVFSSLHLYGDGNTGGYEAFNEALPFGVTFDDTYSGVEKKLGQPQMSRKQAGMNVCSWRKVNGHDVSCHFIPDSAKLAVMTVSLVNLLVE